MAIDPRTRYPRPPFKSQQQDNSGSSARMEPEPSYGEDSYRGSGKLEGRVAVAARNHRRSCSQTERIPAQIRGLGSFW
jgi:hypothetical protein